jgi:hypothetical protein
VAGIGEAGPAYPGPLFARVHNGIDGIFLGARTSSLGGGGRYGLFYVAVPFCSTSSASVWLYGLQQDGENRTNLAPVNTGETNEDFDVFRIEIFDGNTGLKANTVEGITVPPKRWVQIGSILQKYAFGGLHGYARVTRPAGRNAFITYAVINDGEKPGDRTDDGAFVSSSP